MKKFISLWLVNAVSLWIVDYFSSAISFNDTMAIIVTALALTVLNSTIKPLLKVLSAPLSFLTFGLFSLVVNGFVLWVAFGLSDGSQIASFGSAIWISILLAFVNSLINKVMGD
ncbi:MAG: phage holin family protein [Solobacterium sp.]|nr:phage holin family protein [Solobacterium sp.]